MKYCIDSEVIKSFGISINDFFILMFKANKIKLHDTKNLIENGYLTEDGKITQEGCDLFDDIIIKSDKGLPKEDEMEMIAEAMRDIYPTGKKPGTSYYWTDSTKLVTRRLQAFFKKYGKFTAEQILEATETYVKQFENDPEKRLMRLLKYFIFKESRDSDGMTVYDSELLNIIEHKGEIDETGSFDFSRTL